MIKNATNEKLKAAIEKHLAETENQVTRLEDCFKAIGKKVADGVADGTIDKIKPYTPYIVLGGVILLGVLILSRQPRVVVVLAR